MREQEIIENDNYKIRVYLDEYNHYSKEYKSNYDITYNPKNYNRLTSDTIVFEIETEGDTYTVAMIDYAISEDKDNAVSTILRDKILYVLFFDKIILFDIVKRKVIKDTTLVEASGVLYGFAILGNNFVLYSELNTIIYDKNFNFISILSLPGYSYEYTFNIDSTNNYLIAINYNTKIKYIFNEFGKLISTETNTK